MSPSSPRAHACAVGVATRRCTRRLSVPAAIRWEIIRWAKGRGYRWYDLGGLHEEALRALLAGDRHHSVSWPSSDQTNAAFGDSAYRCPDAVEMINSTR
jgi:hypothetical protein